MEAKRLVAELTPDGMLILPAEIRKALAGVRWLMVTRLDKNIVLTPQAAPETLRGDGDRVAEYQAGRIVSDPAIMAGTPVIAGTRIPVRTIIGYLRAGHTVEEIIAEFPHLTPEDIEAAVKFNAAQRARTA